MSIINVLSYPLTHLGDQSDKPLRAAWKQCASEIYYVTDVDKTALLRLSETISVNPQTNWVCVDHDFFGEKTNRDAVDNLPAIRHLFQNLWLYHERRPHAITGDRLGDYSLFNDQLLKGMTLLCDNDLTAHSPVSRANFLQRNFLDSHHKADQ